MAAMAISPFNPNDEKYKCCCQNCHSITGVKTMMVLNIISLVFEVLSLFGGGGGSGIFSLLVTLGVTICLYMALRTEKPGWLIPQLIECVIVIAAFIVLALCCVLLGFVGADLLKDAYENNPDINELLDSGNLAIAGIVLAVCCVLVALLYLWIFAFIKSANNFYRDQEAYRLITPAVPMQQQQAYYAAASPQAPPPYASAPYPQK